MPPALTAATGVDALTHAIESCVSRKATKLTIDFSLRAAGRLARFLPVAFASPDDAEARRECLLGSLEAGIAFTNSSVALVHGMARPLGAKFGIPHGVSNAVLLEAIMRFSASRRTGTLCPAGGSDGGGSGGNAFGNGAGRARHCRACWCASCISPGCVTCFPAMRWMPSSTRWCGKPLPAEAPPTIRVRHRPKRLRHCTGRLFRKAFPGAVTAPAREGFPHIFKTVSLGLYRQGNRFFQAKESPLCCLRERCKQGFNKRKSL